MSLPAYPISDRGSSPLRRGQIPQCDCRADSLVDLLQRPHLDGAHGTSGHAHRLRFAQAQIAFAHPPFDRIVLRRAVRTPPGAVAAADTTLGVVDHDAILRPFTVRAGGTAGHTGRILAVVARHRNVVGKHGGEFPALKAAHLADSPTGSGVMKVLACDLTRLAVDALGGIDEEADLRLRRHRTFST